MIVRLAARCRQQGNDAGQIVPLIIAYALIALTLVIVLVDITAVHLQRDRLFAVADGAALDAADALDQARFYRTGALGTQPTQLTQLGQPTQLGQTGTAAVPLTDQSVRDSAANYLRAAGADSRLTAITLDPATGTPDGVTAQVALAARAQLPLFSFVVVRWSDGVALHATSRARAITGP